jgi:trehalose 2-sulfotransferase
MSDGLSPNESNESASEFELREAFDFNFEVKLKKKYLILSSPWTGSAMLASALYHTGLAGVPFEYFHSRLLKARNNPELRPNELGAYLDDIIKRRTSPNGYFGMKLHFEQFDYLFGRNPTLTTIGIKFLSEFDKRILVYRRDKILQSVSALLAREDKVWPKTGVSNTDLLQRALSPDDVVEISDSLRMFIWWEHCWRKVISRLDGCLEIAYEDLCSDTQTEFAKIFEYLELPELRTRQVAVPTVKQANVVFANELKKTYLEKIGAFDVNNIEILEEIVR